MTSPPARAVLLLALLAACGGENEAKPSLEVVEISEDVMALRFDPEGTEIYRIDAWFGGARLVLFVFEGSPELSIEAGVTFEREDLNEFTLLTIRSEVYSLASNYLVLVASSATESNRSFDSVATDQPSEAELY